jgi:general secretion pathway protein D
VEKPLSEMLKQLEKSMGINIRLKSKYLESVGYSEESTLVGPLRLVKVTNEKALRAILDDASGANIGTPNELSYTVDSGEITISTRQDLSRPVISPEVMHVRVYDTRDILRGWAWASRFFPALGPPQLAPISEGGGGAGGAEGGTGGGTGGQTGGQLSLGGTAQATAEPNATPSQILRTLIQGSIDPPSWEPNGPGQINIWNDQLVIRQTPANHAAIADLLNEIRQAKEIEVSIEARFITVSSSYLEDIGGYLDFYFTKLGSHWSNIHVYQYSEDFTANISTGVTSIGEDITFPALTFTGSFLDDVQVDFFLRATQANRDTRILNAPRLTLLNGTQAQIWVGEARQYVTNYNVSVVEPNLGNPYVTVEPQTSTMYFGTSLQIDASVSADLKYVTLRIRPWIRTLSDTRTVDLITEGASGPLTLPLELLNWDTKTLDTTVTVPDGGTLLLGGLKKLNQAEKEMGVPILSKIPIINRGFSNRAKVKDDSTLIILIKPTIIVPRHEEERQFP